jgi:hypothetical protein
MSRDAKISTILINRLFQLEIVPVEVVDATIAHELTHYLHGFSSPLEQKFSTPHAGGVVTKELKKRGFESAKMVEGTVAIIGSRACSGATEEAKD